MKIGVIKEEKVPPDERVPLSPKQCKEIKDKFPSINLVVQTSNIRRFKDEDYLKQGIEIVENVNDCDVLFGVKEVPIKKLIPNKTYFFFSHTTKKQPYNKNLLKTMLEKHITMVDYEGLKNKSGIRLIGFGRYAGIVGCYNAFYTYGKRVGNFNLKRAYLCEDQIEMEAELTKIKLPKNYKIIITGGGRVAHGAIEILDKLNIKKVSPASIKKQQFNHAVFAQLQVENYNKRINNQHFTRHDFYNNPTDFHADFMKYAKVADMYIACHFWNAKSPYIFTREDAKQPDFNIKVVADISCDIDGPVASTLRPSTIKDPIYGYNPQTEKEVDFNTEDSISVMAVDNLPCELPKDASANFGRELIDKVFPHLLNDEKEVIAGATICKNGKLMPQYNYLTDYVTN